MKTREALLSLWREYRKANPIGLLPISRLIGVCRETLVRFDTEKKQIGNISLIKIERFLEDWDNTRFVDKANK